MKFFLDTANVEHIREANDMGVICGVTTNPSLIAKEGKAGADISTVPYNLVMQMVKHPLTDQGLKKFKSDWAAAFGKE